MASRNPVRGKVSAAPGDFIKPRYIDHSDARAAHLRQAWPTAHLAGAIPARRAASEPRAPFSSAAAAVPAPPPPAPQNFPAWAALGSYVVCRRLQQDVPAFWKFAIGAAGVLGIDPVSCVDTRGSLAQRRSHLAPAAADDAALAGDEWANNHFIFNDDTKPSMLRPIPGYPGDAFPQAVQDMLGTVCPHFAHIRKTNRATSPPTWASRTTAC